MCLSPQCPQRLTSNGRRRSSAAASRMRPLRAYTRPAPPWKLASLLCPAPRRGRTPRAQHATCTYWYHHDARHPLTTLTRDCHYLKGIPVIKHRGEPGTHTRTHRIPVPTMASPAHHHQPPPTQRTTQQTNTKPTNPATTPPERQRTTRGVQLNQRSQDPSRQRGHHRHPKPLSHAAPTWSERRTAPAQLPPGRRCGPHDRHAQDAQASCGHARTRR